MTAATRTVTYTLAARSTGVAGLERFQQSLTNILRVQDQIKRNGDVLGNLRDRTATVRLRFETTALDQELRRLSSRTVSLKVKVADPAQVQNDINTLRALLGSVGTNTQYVVTVNTTALSALNSDIHTNILALQSLISQLRALGAGPRPGPGPTPPGGGAGGSGGINPATRADLAELERLNNLWTRGQINAADYARELTAVQTRLQAAAAAAGVGTREFAQADAGITRITRSLRSINTDSFQKIRTDAGAMRTAFDQATAGVERNSAAFNAAQATYSAASATIIARLQAMQSSSTLTTQQLGQVNRELQRLAREANTVNGNINHAGLSGSVVNSFGALGGQFGMIIAQGTAMVAMFRSIQATAGPAALAMAGFGAAGLVAGGALVALGATGLGEVKKLQQGLNILQANGVKDLGAIEDSVKSLQTNLGLVGESFSRGDLVNSLADTIKAGVDADSALTLMASSSRLAAAEQIGLNDASGLLLKNIRQYSKDISEAARVGDMLAKSGNLAAGTANDLSIGLGIVGGTGYQAKIEMNDLLGMLVELDNKGMSAADVGANGLRAALSALADITKKGQGVLKELGIEFNDASGKARPAGDIMIDLGAKMRGMGIVVDKTTGTLSGNGEALRTVSSLMDNRAAAAVINLTGDWKMYGAQVKDSNGYLIEYSETMQQGVAPAMNRVKNAFAEAGGEFVKTFADPLASFLTNTMTPLLKDLGALFEKLQQMKETGTVKLSVLFTPGDSTTARILGILGAPVAGGMAIGQQMNVSELQRALQRGGLIEEPGTPGAALAQRKEIERNYAEWLKLAQENDARIQAGIKNPTGPLAPVTGPPITTGTLDGLRGDIVGQALIGQTGNNVADTVAGWCARWVKLTLQKADPAASKEIEKLFGGASANAVKNKAAAAGVLNRDMSKLKPGDVVIYDDNHIGIYVGKQNGVDMVRGNNQWGVQNGRGVVSTEKMSSLGSVAGFVSVPQLLGSEKAPAGTMPPPAAAYAGLTAAQIAQAQALNAAVEKAQKALNADPKNVALIKALDSAKEKAKDWGEKSDTNARALTAVSAAQSTLKKTSEEYIATQADLNRYGAEALRLLKAQEAAQASGNTARILAADNAVQAWQTDKKLTDQQRQARAEVLRIEGAAYQTRKQAAEQARQDAKQAERDAEQDAKEAERRAKEQAQLRARVADQARQLTVQAAQDSLARTQELNRQELAAFKGTSAQRLSLIERQASDEYAAKERAARAVRDKQLAANAIGGQQNRAGLDAAANRAYDQALLEAGGARTTTVTQAREKESQAVQKLRADYSKLADSIRAHAEAGTFDEAARQEALKSFNELGRAGAQAGLTTESHIKGARQSVWSLVGTATEATTRLSLLNFGGAIIDPATGKLLYKTDEEVRGIGVAAEDAAADFFDLGNAIENVGFLSQSELTDLIQQSGLAADEAERLQAAWDALYGSINTGPQLADNLQGRGVPDVASLDPTDPSTGALSDSEAQALRERMDTMNLVEVRAILDELDPSGTGETPLILAIRGYLTDQATAITDSLLANGGMSQSRSTDADGNAVTTETFLTDADVRGQTEKVDTLEEAYFDLEGAIQNVLNMPWDELSALLSASDLKPDQIQAITAAWREFHQAGQEIAAMDEARTPAVESLSALMDGFTAGDIGMDGFRSGLAKVRAELQALADAGDETAKRLISLVDDTVQGTRDLEDAVATGAAQGLEQRHQQGLISERQYIDERERLTVEGAQRTFEREIEGLVEGTPAYKAAQQRLENARTQAAAEGTASRKELQQQELQSLSGYINKAGSILGKFTEGEDGNVIGYLVKNAQLGVEAFGQFLAGDFVGMAMTTVEWLMNIGDAFENLSPDMKAWKKDLAEVAKLQREAAGQAKYNGWLENPYHKDLQADANARDQMANSKWYQRVWWGLTNTGPKMLDDATAKFKIKAATIFDQLGSELGNTFESSLLEGFDMGDFSKVSEKIERGLNQFAARLVIQGILAQSKVAALSKAYAEARARGESGDSEMADLRAEIKAVTGTAQDALSGLEGYGAGAEEGSSAATAASSPVTGATFVIANSSKIDLFDATVTRIDAMYLRHEAVMTRHGEILSRSSDMLERLMRDGIPLIDSSGNYRGALR